MPLYLLLILYAHPNREEHRRKRFRELFWDWIIQKKLANLWDWRESIAITEEVRRTVLLSSVLIVYMPYRVSTASEPTELETKKTEIICTTSK